ncbi:MAG: hypothetical protein J6Y53_02150 [Alphaproteobacteria bacterium]|nr:hypothetical protein [Alphaproteobacteria bacterium]
MEPENLSDQVKLVTDASKRDFGHYIEVYTLKSQAIMKLFKPRIFQGREKFELYIKLHGQLKLEDERKLLETRRRDLQEIYFKYCSCHKVNERLVVRNPEIAALYYKEHCPCPLAQKELLQAKPKSIYLFIKEYPFCAKVKKMFLKMADLRLRNYYLLKHPA